MDNSISDDNLVLLKNALEQKADEDLLWLWDILMESSAATKGHAPDSDHLFQRIMLDGRLQPNFSKDTKKIKTTKRLVTLVAAACILVFLKFAIDFINGPDPIEAGLSTKSAIGTITPGGNKARIVLADGTQLDLETVKIDTVIQLEGYAVHKTADGSITYTVTDEHSLNGDMYNTIITPKGGAYNLTLSDGTKIAMNASSTLRYPIRFQEDARAVELKGEAYFDVSKQYRDGNRIPFIVETDQQTLEVLGTAFNVNSYGRMIQTTLVEGSVRISFDNGQSHVLKPNQQAVYTRKSKRTAINTVDPFYVLAWKNGSFAFEDASIEEVMESVGRWYDVDVAFKGDLKDKRFSGTISRFENIQKLLQTVELTGSVKFEIKGRRILVME
ncbi:FecR family protein [Sphingobacterium haloxyli]|nr:FecR domain-containing protein [Sphingobacterium haloxyli]